MSGDASNKRHVDGFVPFAGQQHKKVKQSQSPKPPAAVSLTITQTSTGSTNPVIDDTLFNDAIYSTVKMDALCVAIINTKQFQRLAHLKQLGTCNYVFRGAQHTRFEHSVGVAHLAERVAKTFQRNQPELGITAADILCVKVAGLCHDLGHGPFSHVYDGVFIKRMHPNGIDPQGNKWLHEDGSIFMLKQLIRENNIRLEEYGLSEIDETFIVEMIGGTPEKERKGRSRNKSYLYDIVNNTRSGLDVDKMDYFQRDMRNTSSVNSVANFERFIELARVFRAEPIVKKGYNDRDRAPSELQAEDYPYMICYPEKLCREAVDIFALRFRLHQTVYTHKTVKKVEYMITDALALADPFIKIPGTKTERFPDGLYKMSECVYDTTALTNLRDDVLAHITTYNQDPALQPAKELLERVVARKLYTCLGRSNYSEGFVADDVSEQEIAQDIVDIAASLLRQYASEDSIIMDGENDEEEPPYVLTSSTMANRVQSATAAGNCFENASVEGGEEEGEESAANDDDDDADIIPNGAHTRSAMKARVLKNLAKDVQRSKHAASSSVFSQDSQHVWSPVKKTRPFLSSSAASAGGSPSCDKSNKNKSGNHLYDSAGSPIKISYIPVIDQVPMSASKDYVSSFSKDNLSISDLIVEKMHIHYGQKARNPVDNMRFFPKDAPSDWYVEVN